MNDLQTELNKGYSALVWLDRRRVLGSYTQGMKNSGFYYFYLFYLNVDCAVLARRPVGRVVTRSPLVPKVLCSVCWQMKLDVFSVVCCFLKGYVLHRSSCAKICPHPIRRSFWVLHHIIGSVAERVKRSRFYNNSDCVISV